MCSKLSWFDHIPDTDRSRRWAPHPDRDASEYRRRSGVGVPKRIPSRRWSLTIYQERSSSACRDRGTGRWGGSLSEDQWDFRCHCTERILSLPWGTSFSSDDMCPNNTCQSWAGGLGRDRNCLAIERNFSTRTTVGRLGRPLCLWTYLGTPQTAMSWGRTSLRLSLCLGSDKERAVLGRGAWLWSPRRPGPASRPDTREVELCESGPKLTPLQKLSWRPVGRLTVRSRAPWTDGPSRPGRNGATS